jgi:hypothetical protein
VFAKLFLAGNIRLQVMLMDISPGGTRLYLPPANPLAGVECGLRASISEFPPFLRQLDGLSGVLAWKNARSCGIRFDQALGAALEALIGQSVKL